LYDYKVPRINRVCRKLPKHIDGKMVKRELEKRYWEDKGIKRRG